MNSQHSTDAEETPTTETSRSETLREVLDGPIDTKSTPRKDGPLAGRGGP
jgi:hypothetical protein